MPVLRLSWERGEILPVLEKAGNGISWTLRCHTGEKAPGNSLPGRLKSPWVSASGEFPAHFARHGKSACWETRWIFGIYGGQSSPSSSRRISVAATRGYSSSSPCPALPTQTVSGGTQLNLSHLSHLSFPAPFLCSCSPAEGKTLPHINAF